MINRSSDFYFTLKQLAKLVCFLINQQAFKINSIKILVYHINTYNTTAVVSLDQASRISVKLRGNWSNNGCLQVLFNVQSLSAHSLSFIDLIHHVFIGK